MHRNIALVLRSRPRRFFAVAVNFATVFLTMISLSAVAMAEEPEIIQVSEWIVLGPVDIPVPAFTEEGDEETSAAALLSYDHIARKGLWPGNGDGAQLSGSRVSWRVSGVDSNGVHFELDGDRARFSYVAAYIEAPRWLKVDVTARGSSAFELWVDGESVANHKKAETSPASGSAKLVQGRHLVLAKVVVVPGDSLSDWWLDVSFSLDEDTPGAFSVGTDPTRAMNISDVLDGPGVSSVRVSPDGSLVALVFGKRTPPEGTSDGWTEIRKVRDGSLVRVIRDTKGSSWQWVPTGHRLSYVTRDDDKAALRVVDLDTGGVETIVEDVKDFGGYDWSPDGTFVAYSVNTEAEKGKTGVLRLRSVGDRRAGERDRSSIYITSVPGGMTRRVTAGEHSTWVYDIHPDGFRVLIGRSYEELSKRGYSKGELFVLDLRDQSTELLHTSRWMNSARWSPDGKHILVLGGPSCFGELGHNLPDGAIANEYDQQAYIFDPETRKAEAITRDFDPALRSAHWPSPGRSIYFVAEEGEFVRLYRYDVRQKSYTQINVDCDVIRARSFATDREVAVVTGSGANRPARVFSVDLRKGKSRLLAEPAKDRFEDVRVGEVKDFDFTADSGRSIVGRVHFPPNFDPDKKWPAIVYYYGGTSPVGRSFAGRYPKNLWAAHGYVVYVLQPSGATGFGQSFSALHVNDWGKVVVDEIIDGTLAFLAAHPYVDPTRIGCIGASFGGFMTQLLVTRTNIFEAAVSHAGISMISSYWGEGYWGYGYNSISAANSFPWNRPDIYVDQSPLSKADNVTTPLLLLHGAADTNVPPGESEQMYTALKLLGKEVEYIRVEGQNHWIIDYKKRIVWSDAIVSWFDRWLKEEPEWWNDMYPPLDGHGNKAKKANR